MGERVKDKRCYCYLEAWPCPFINMKEKPSVLYSRTEENGEQTGHQLINTDPQLLLPYSLALRRTTSMYPSHKKRGFNTMWGGNRSH